MAQEKRKKTNREINTRIRLLPNADLAVPVTLNDLGEGQTWPPDRCRKRNERMQRQYELSKGKYNYFIPEEPQRTRQYNRVGGLFDATTALLLATNPGLDIDDLGVRLSLHNAIEKVAYDALRHGRGIFLGIDNSIRSLDIRNTYPLESGASLGWVSVERRITSDSVNGDPNIVIIYVWDREAETYGGIIRELNGENRFGKVIGEVEALSCTTRSC